MSIKNILKVSLAGAAFLALSAMKKKCTLPNPLDIPNFRHSNTTWARVEILSCD